MPGPFVAVQNLGCRVNRAESDRMQTGLARAGLAIVPPDDADVIVVNTCAVTGEAEAKTRKAVRHALGRRRQPTVVVTGCAANLHPEMLAELSDRVVVEPSKVDVVDRVLDVLDLGPAPGALAPSASEATRAIGRGRLGVKIQDGCNNRCTYCIVWKARGPERSVPVDAVLDEVREISEAGIPEAVLTGVNLGAYDGTGPGDEHVEIDELVRLIMEETDIPQLRLSSIEPDDVSDRLIQAMAEYGGRVAPFLHLPLQSGCEATLGRMGRHYSASEFLELTSKIRSAVPGIALSCDVIVGFPGEDEREFAESLRFCEEVGFSRMHVFRYSPRPGTPAAEAAGQVAAADKDARSRAMRELASRMMREDALGRVGTSERAVIERGDVGTLGSFHAVRVEDAPAFEGPSLVEVGIIGMGADGMLTARIGAAAPPCPESASR